MSRTERRHAPTLTHAWRVSPETHGSLPSCPITTCLAIVKGNRLVASSAPPRQRRRCRRHRHRRRAFRRDSRPRKATGSTTRALAASRPRSFSHICPSYCVASRRVASRGVARRRVESHRCVVIHRLTRDFGTVTRVWARTRLHVCGPRGMIPSRR